MWWVKWAVMKEEWVQLTDLKDKEQKALENSTKYLP